MDRIAVLQRWDMKRIFKCPDKIAYVWKAALQCSLRDGEACGFQQMLCVG